MANIDVIKSIHTVQILPYLRSSLTLNQGLFKNDLSIAVVITVIVEEVD